MVFLFEISKNLSTDAIFILLPFISTLFDNLTTVISLQKSSKTKGWERAVREDEKIPITRAIYLYFGKKGFWIMLFLTPLLVLGAVFLVWVFLPLPEYGITVILSIIFLVQSIVGCSNLWHYYKIPSQ
ncbi:hypothetical protein AUJ17_01060 [Candidatus Micrarchaeota archaeon CG1_02_47_40]|nr:MAG: hypothetical protein AUJ17_01060 [Candidatus Micrarchaeota archaeon CG1_02_47_40]